VARADISFWTNFCCRGLATNTPIDATSVDFTCL
jgi:hypothetical protein